METLHSGGAYTCVITMSHQHVQPHVTHNVAAIACYRLEKTLVGCSDPFLRGLLHPISVLELTKNEVDGRTSTTMRCDRLKL